ncbi:hemerythrin domain-containing protein [Nocardioides sp.]|uniref:hemerythrin domain-containing protein n=1 Tax=Nocardioides sp. TaxID=35761 RepID=UPI0027359560|nr:hemerythrin domain-containing protein [Nocardioides sp.]MDP3891189.1 hemerythrin domain-containing protein [Nocardioides sp.]
MTHTTEPLTDVHDMVVVHRAFRREFTLLPVLVRAVGPGGTGRAEIVAAHARMILKGLRLHHTSEDELLWPKLLERAAPEAALIARMEAQHEQVGRLLERLEPALQRWRVEARPAVTEEVASTLESLRTALLVHLDEEEREILPLAARHLTQAEWAELGEHGVAAMSSSELPILFGAVLEDATAEEQAGLVVGLPLVARLLLRPVILPRYRRYARRVRAEL